MLPRGMALYAEEIEGSFQVVRDSTGRNDTEGRDFCADLVEFTG